MLPSQYHKNQWKIIEKITFRFVFLFLTGFIVLMFFGRFLEPLFVWIGTSIFKISEGLKFKSTGSGDGTMSWISVFFQLIIAVAGTIIWSILDRKRPDYNVLYYWLRACLRIFVAIFMLLYGFAKVFLIQFREPSLTQLLQPLGDMSPMGLAWTYMGYSPAFTIFTGLLEVIAGVLLIPRRTQTLGAFMVVGVMTHVMMMNMCYDIPVKIFSTHLVIMGLVLLLSDRRRIGIAFFNQNATQGLNYYTPIKQEFHKAIRIIKILGLAVIGILALAGGFLQLNRLDKKHEKSSLYGIWETQTFIKNGDTIAPLTTVSDRWKYLVIEHKKRSTVKTMTDSIIPYHFITDSTRTRLSFYHKNADSVSNNFTLHIKDSTQFSMQGLLDGHRLEIHFKAKDLKEINLINRGFHWINETPFNR